MSEMNFGEEPEL